MPFRSEHDLGLPQVPKIGEISKEELYAQFLDVYNALRILQDQIDSRVENLLDAMPTPEVLPKTYEEL